MKEISVKTALIAAWCSIALVAAVSVAAMIGIIVMASTWHWPMYYAFPIALIVPITIMIVSFGIVAKLWLVWAYSRVTDIVELEQASQMSGFGAYGIGSLKDGRVKDELMERFETYAFEDDPEVPEQTEIYFRKFYQNIYFIVPAVFCVVSGILVAASGVVTSIILPIIFAAVAIVSYVRSADSSPQIALDSQGIRTSDFSYEWNQIRECEITAGKNWRLNLHHDGKQESFLIGRLKIGKIKLNHLLHVYRQRDKTVSQRRTHFSRDLLHR